MPGTPGRAPALLRSRGGLKRPDRVVAYHERASETNAVVDARRVATELDARTSGINGEVQRLGLSTAPRNDVTSCEADGLNCHRAHSDLDVVTNLRAQYLALQVHGQQID
jgi:hypothetical protein